MRVALVLATATLVGACAALVSLDAPDSPPDATSSSGTSGETSSGQPSTSSGNASSGNGTSGMSSTSGTASSSSSGMAEAGQDAPAPDTGNCKPDGKCTGGQKCAEDRKCRDFCTGTGVVCIFGSNSCCLGSYCPFDFPASCKTCIKDNDQPDEDALDKPLARSCCSGHIGGDGKCAKAPPP